MLLTLIALLAATSVRAADGVSTAEVRPGGLAPVLAYKSDFVRNVRGGIERGGAWAGVFTVGAEFDFGRLASLPGLAGMVELMAIQGTAPSRLVGDMQTLSNLQAERGFGLSQAWLGYESPEGRVAVLAGVHDLNTDFYENSGAALFLNGSFGVGAELAVSGVNGVATFPYTALGARARVRPVERVYAQAAVYDGIPGDPTNLKGNTIKLGEEDGAFYVAEAGFASVEGDRLPTKMGIGAWTYSREHDDLLDVNEEGEAMKRRSAGAYVVAQQKLYEPRAGAAAGLTSFARFGVGTPSVSMVAYNAAAGLVYDGLFASARSDSLGLGVTVAGASARFRERALLNDGRLLAARETAFELTYRANPFEWLSVQPDVQVVVSPGFDGAIDSATVLGVRVETRL